MAISDERVGLEADGDSLIVKRSRSRLFGYERARSPAGLLDGPIARSMLFSD